MKVHDLLHEDALGSLGFELMCKRVLAGDKVKVKKETVAAMCSTFAGRDFNMKAKRHAELEKVTYPQDRLYPYLMFVMPCNTSYWVTATVEMDPPLQEGWMMQKLGKGWLAWREM